MGQIEKIISDYAWEKEQETILTEKLNALQKEKDELTVTVDNEKQINKFLYQILRLGSAYYAHERSEAYYSSFHRPDKPDVNNPVVKDFNNRIQADLTNILLDFCTLQVVKSEPADLGNFGKQLFDELKPMLPENYDKKFDKAFDDDALVDLINTVMNKYDTDLLNPYISMDLPKSPNKYIHNMSIKEMSCLNENDRKSIEEDIMNLDFPDLDKDEFIKECETYIEDRGRQKYTFSFEDANNKPLIEMKIVFTPAIMDICDIKATDNFKEQFKNLSDKQIETLVNEVGNAIKGYQNKLDRYFLTPIENIYNRQHKITNDLRDKHHNLEEEVSSLKKDLENTDLDDLER